MAHFIHVDDEKNSKLSSTTAERIMIVKSFVVIPFCVFHAALLLLLLPPLTLRGFYLRLHSVTLPLIY